MTPVTVVRATLAASLIAAAAPAMPQPAAPKQGTVRALPTDTKPWKGDLDGMIERRMVRVLVPTAARSTSTTRGASAGSRPT